MHRSLTTWNRFLRLHSFYPLFLSSMMACAFYVFRVLYSGSSNYANLLWNLVLAWLPYIFAVIAASAYGLIPKRWWLILLFGLLWLVFFPNAPYIVTDFYYLDPRPPIPLWFDISLIAIFAFTGCFLAIASLFALLALSLASFGVYLGRFGRYNSWDIILEPKSLLKEIASNLLNPLDNLGFLGFTIMFTSILLVFYLMYETTPSQNDNFQ
jgi:uncharacterized membrane protein